MALGTGAWGGVLSEGSSHETLVIRARCVRGPQCSINCRGGRVIQVIRMPRLVGVIRSFITPNDASRRDRVMVKVELLTYLPNPRQPAYP
ncbi:hypothetical protein AVEN_147388-1 [Araneus ventricosus]|uniref:Uncharacterized protein n=1 Tax=Araneus ventricosus TaxID=182803 RepID=A0A4Y2FVI4_ARAVE|nr:hypothetical protein AVEN_147388-1 [Araneus ventricosus]